MTTTEQPYPRSELPKLKLVQIAIIGNLIGFLVGLLTAIDPGGIGVSWGLSFAFFQIASFAINYRTYGKLIERRQKVRDENFRDWLVYREVPEVQESENWEEIEAAVEMLLAEDMEPTIERAKDLIRKAKQGLCDHQDSMDRITLMNGLTYWRCKVCSANVQHGQLAPPPQPIPEGAPLTPFLKKFFEVGDKISDIAEGKPICEHCGEMHYSNKPCRAGNPFRKPRLDREWR